jgi:cytochrome c peroxidase
LIVTLALWMAFSSGCGAERAPAGGPDPASDASAADPDTDLPEPRLEDPTGFFRRSELVELEEFGPLGEPPVEPTNRVSDDPRAAHFGRYLFYDEGLSGNGKVSCASCHPPGHGFAEPDRLSEGMGTTDRHAPTLLNAAYQQWFFWDGRADSLWAQVHTPMEAPREQGISRAEVAHYIHDTPELERAYETIFGPLPDLSNTDRFPEAARPVPDDPDHPEHRAWQSMSDEAQRAVNRVMANVGKAIGAFERRLVSKNAPFDRFMRGLRQGDADKIAALSRAARRGLRLFIGKADCNECHTGPLLSDRSFHNTGLPTREWLDDADTGRWAGIPVVKNDTFNALGPFSDDPDAPIASELEFVVRKSENRGQFETPTLRNVEQTAPYMHGGHFRTLEQVVEFYANLEPTPSVGQREGSLRPFELTERQKDDLVAFLESLTGEPVPARLTRQPEHPLPD